LNSYKKSNRENAEKALANVVEETVLQNIGQHSKAQGHVRGRRYVA